MCRGAKSQEPLQIIRFTAKSGCVYTVWFANRSFLEWAVTEQRSGETRAAKKARTADDAGGPSSQRKRIALKFALQAMAFAIGDGFVEQGGSPAAVVNLYLGHCTRLTGGANTMMLCAPSQPPARAAAARLPASLRCCCSHAPAAHTHQLPACTSTETPRGPWVYSRRTTQIEQHITFRIKVPGSVQACSQAVCSARRPQTGPR